ncbi:MAG: EcsC family protein [Pseudomonadota bacterium]
MHDILIVEPVDADIELDRLVGHYRAANGVGIRLLNTIGGGAESLLDRLPEPVRAGLYDATESALHVALKAAEGSRKAVPDQKTWVNSAVATAMGAAGGLGGIPTALVELPLTTTMLLRAIQGVAAENGFDPSSESVRFDCVRVFSAAGPLAMDDGADLGFITMRLTLTGNAVQQLVTAVAPKLATVMGQKLATQMVPVMGAMAGAGTNYTYAKYYQKIAQVHFGLRRLAIDGDIPHDQLIARLSEKMLR